MKALQRTKETKNENRKGRGGYKAVRPRKRDLTVKITEKKKVRPATLTKAELLVEGAGRG